MLKKILKTILISFVLITSITTDVSALTHKYYTLNIDGITEDTKRYVSSVLVEDDTKSVFINNVNVGTITSDPQTVSLLTTNYKITATISLSNLTCNLSVDAKTQKNYKSLFKIELENNEYYVCYFYPDSEDSSYYQKEQSVRNGDIHNFGTYSYKYGDSDTKTFDVSMVQSSGAVYVNGDYVTTLDLKSTPVVFEYIGEDFPLSTEYVEYAKGTLSKYTWLDASQTNRVYYNRNFGDIAIKQNYDLENEYLNLPKVEMAFGADVNYYKRVEGTSTTGTGVWESQGSKIAVVCEYYENNQCGQAIRSEFPRYWAVYPDYSAKYPQVSISTKEITAKITEKDQESGYVPTSGNITNLKYSYRTSSWGEPNNWTSYYIDSCSSNSDCKYETRTKYAKATGMWGSYGAETSYYIDSCSSSGDCQYQTRDEYSNYSYGVSKSGYTEACEQKWYENNYSCGTHYEYGDYTYGSSAHGYTDTCTSKWFEKNYSCGTHNVDCNCRQQTKNCSTCTSCQTCSGTKNCSTCTSCQTCSGTKNCSTCGGGCTRYQYYGGTKYCTQTAPTYTCGCETYYYSCNCSSYTCGCESYTYSCNCSSYTCGCETYTACDTCTENNSCYLQNCATSRSTVNNSCNMWDCPQTKTTYYKYRYRTWTDYGDYIYDSCTYDETTNCKSQKQYAYQYKIWTDWSSWMPTTEQINNTSENTQYKYKYDIEKEGKQTVSVVSLDQNNKWAGSSAGMLTYDGVEKWQTEYAQHSVQEKAFNDAYKNAIEDIKTGNKYVLLDDYQEKVTTNLPQALRDIQNQEIYSPYLYFWAWRFIDANFDLPSGTAQKYISANKTTCYLSNGDLIVNEDPIDRKTKVIYFDYHDPLTNYDEIPENWQGYEDLLSEIENSDMSSYKIKVKISGEDLAAMKKWIKDNPDKLNDGSCQILREFSYIFIDVNPELAEWLASGDSCEIKEENKNG